MSKDKNLPNGLNMSQVHSDLISTLSKEHGLLPSKAKSSNHSTISISTDPSR